ncbi:unnamed protein product [Rotaria sp. Silwood2]|nr:unnamed protein product [Rotaria sp. Silwood2]
MNLSHEIVKIHEKMTNQIEAIQTQTQEWQKATMSKLEEKQQEWEQLTGNFRDMKMEIQNICETLRMQTLGKNNHNQLIEENISTTHTERNSSTIEELSDNGQLDQHNGTEQRQHAENNARQVLSNERIAQTAHTIIIPPSSSIPTFSGSIMESPHQFLVRVKEYTETINHWNEQLLLNGISQFLRGTALEWYCQLRVSNRRPQTWAEFKVIFLNQFNSPIRRA